MVVVDYSNVPNNPMDDQLLVELGDGEPPKDKNLKQQATHPKHMRLNFSNSPCYPSSVVLDKGSQEFGVLTAKLSRIEVKAKQPMCLTQSFRCLKAISSLR